MGWNYAKIFKQAFYLTKGYKFFWRAGLFLVWPVLLQGLLVVLLVYERMSPSEGDRGWIGGPGPYAQAWVGVVSLIVIAVLTALYFRSKAGVTVAVKELKTKTSIDPSKVMAESEPYTIRLLKLGFGLGMALLLVTGLLLMPVVYLDELNYSARAVILGLLALAIYAPTFIFLYYSMIFSPLFMVAHGLSIADSMRSSFDLARKCWPQLLALSAIMLAAQAVGLVVGVSVSGLVLSLFVLIFRMVYDMGGLDAAPALQALAGTATFVVFFMSQVLVTAFIRVAWAVAFFEIVRPAKPEVQEETAPVPEVIS